MKLFLLGIFILYSLTSFSQESIIPQHISEGDIIKVRIIRSSCYKQMPPTFITLSVEEKKLFVRYEKLKPYFYEIVKNKNFKRDLKRYGSSQKKKYYKKESKAFLEKCDVVLNKRYYDSIKPFDSLKDKPIMYYLVVRSYKNIVTKTDTLDLLEYQKFYDFYTALKNGDYDEREILKDNERPKVVFAGLGTKYRYSVSIGNEKGFRTVFEKYVQNWRSNKVFTD